MITYQTPGITQEVFLTTLLLLNINILMLEYLIPMNYV
jgi:hypothetical protein